MPGADQVAICGWCGGRLEAAVGAGWSRVRCPSCGVETTWPVPSEADLERAYGSWYRPETGRFSGLGDRVLRRLRGRLAARLDRIAPSGPVLDVGAGDGALLDALGARGRDATGLERHSRRPDILEVELAEVTGRWDAVVFWHSLEHLREPGHALDRAADLLAPGGVVVVAMPNPASIQARLFGERWLALDLPRHLVHVPAPALLERLRTAGLAVERVSYLRGGQATFGWLHGIVGSLPTRPDLYDAIRRSDARRVQISAGRRVITLTAGALALPLAAVAALLEALLRRGGTTYIEARCP
jgi:SAM-dependent methyltransferase